MFVRSSLIVLMLIPLSVRAQLNQRPLKLPTVKDRAPCPVSKRSPISVDRDVFCSFCPWFGNGPVYFSLPFAYFQHNEDASFGLTSTVPFDSYGYEIKIPWVSKPDYSGPILVRGRKLDGAGDKIHFWPVLGFGESGDTGMREEIRITSPNHLDPINWSFWPSGMILSGAGCYGLQIDTASTSDVVIFIAKRPA